MRRILAGLLVFLITATLLFAPLTIAQGPAVDDTLVVCVSAHPDDVEIGISGALYKNDIGIHPIMWVVVTDGGADLEEYNYESNASRGWIAQDGQYSVTWEGPDGSDITRPFYSADLAKKRCGGSFEGLSWTEEMASHDSTFGVAYDWRTRISGFVDAAIEKVQMGYLKQSDPEVRLAYPDAGLVLAEDAFRDSIAANLADEINKYVESNGYQKGLVKIYSHAPEEVCVNPSEHFDHQVVGNAVRQAVELLLTTYGFGQIDAKWFTVYDLINPKEGYVRVDEDISLQQIQKSELAKLCWETETAYARHVNFTWPSYPVDPGTHEWSIVHSYYAGTPAVMIPSPQNKTYKVKTIDLNWSALEPLSWCAFSLNGAANDTSIGPTRWWSNASITPDFNVGTAWSAPDVFQKDGIWFLISGKSDGTFQGFNWTESAWQRDDAIVAGLGSLGSHSRPSVFQKDGTWYLISGVEYGTFFGFNWTGSEWQSDSAIVSGLGYMGSNIWTPEVFQKDGTWYLVSGEAYGWFFGFNWNGSAWQMDDAIVFGLEDVGYHSTPTVFQKNGTWYLISGDNGGGFHGFNRSESIWQSDSLIAAGLWSVGGMSAPTVFEMDDVLHLISGETWGEDAPAGFHGFSWGFGWLNTTITAKEGSNRITVYARNLAGYENGATRYFTVDTTPPTITVLSPQNLTYDSVAVSLTFALDEPPDWIGYSLDDEENVTITGNLTLTGLSDGPHSVAVFANDTLGNMGASNKVYFTYWDHVAPTTTISLSGALADDGWYVSPVQAILEATDDEGGSGIASTAYSLDGVNWTAYTGPFMVNQSTMIYYNSTDNAGNAEPTKTQPIQIATYLYLSDTGWSHPVGTWDPVARIATLSRDIGAVIYVISDNLILDAQGHNMTGPGKATLVDGVVLSYPSGRTGVTIKNLNIREYSSGIILGSCNNCSILDNDVSGNSVGISLGKSNNSRVTGNVANSNRYAGILLSESSNNSIMGNTANHNVWYSGIHLYYNCSNNYIRGNTVTSNEGYGGIHLGYSCSNNILIDNTLSSNPIFLEASSNNNTIARNTISDSVHGITLANSDDTKVYSNNFFNNALHATVIGGSGNNFNLDKLVGGNYWSDYAGTDSDGDGIGDTPYVIDADNADNYPLVTPWNPTLSVAGVTGWYWTSNTAINSIAVDDVDGDGQREIVTAGTFYDATRNVAQLVVWNSSALAPERLVTWYWFGNTTINSVAIGDVDGDGQFEIVTGGSYFDGTRQVAQLVVWNGSSLTVEGIRTWYWIGNTVINSVALGDVDGDGQVEVVTGGYYNDGTRNIAQLVVWGGSDLSVDRLTGWYWTDDTAVNSVAVGDVDNDGQTEIVTGGTFNDGSRDVAQLVVWTGSSLAVDRLTSWYWTSNTAINSVAFGDVDADGQTEIVTGGYFNDGTRNVAQLVVWTGSTLAVDRLTTWYWMGNTVINSVALGDADDDGQIEVVTGGYYNDGARNVAQMVSWSGSSLAVESIRVWYWVSDTVINSVCLSDVNDDLLAETVTGGAYYDVTRWNAQLVVWGLRQSA